MSPNCRRGIPRCVNPSEIKDLVTRKAHAGRTCVAVCVNPSEIKDLVTRSVSHKSSSSSVLVSILQKSRTWLHSGWLAILTAIRPVSILQKSRTWLHGGEFEKVPLEYCVNPSEIKDLVTQRVVRGRDRGRVCVNPSEIKDLVTHPMPAPIPQHEGVSILQKSRTWLHLLVAAVIALVLLCQSFRNQGPGYTRGQCVLYHGHDLCQSFRNQGPGYTAESQVYRLTDTCVNPSEIKDLVTR